MFLYEHIYNAYCFPHPPGSWGSFFFLFDSPMGWYKQEASHDFHHPGQLSWRACHVRGGRGGEGILWNGILLNVIIILLLFYCSRPNLIPEEREGEGENRIHSACAERRNLSFMSTCHTCSFSPLPCLASYSRGEREEEPITMSQEPTQRGGERGKMSKCQNAMQMQ